jgi:branched-chain amino acid transport system permease protein
MALTSELTQYLLSGLTSGAVYAVIALGFTIIYNATEIINFAQGEFVMLGGMAMIALDMSGRFPMAVSFVLAVSAVTLVGMALQRLAIQPVKRPSPITLIIITVGASIFLRGAAMLVWGKDPQGLRPFTGMTPIAIGGATITPQSLWVMGVSLVMMAGLQFFYKRGPHGAHLFRPERRHGCGSRHRHGSHHPMRL